MPTFFVMLLDYYHLSYTSLVDKNWLLSFFLLDTKKNSKCARILCMYCSPQTASAIGKRTLEFFDFRPILCTLYPQKCYHNFENEKGGGELKFNNLSTVQTTDTLDSLLQKNACCYRHATSL